MSEQAADESADKRDTRLIAEAETLIRQTTREMLDARQYGTVTVKVAIQAGNINRVIHVRESSHK
jgi:hypothetical protein